MNLLLKNVNHVEFLTDGVELILGKCTVFPNLGTGWLINLYLCAICQYPLNWTWKIVHLSQSNSTPPLKELYNPKSNQLKFTAINVNWSTVEFTNYSPLSKIPL